MTTMFSMGDYSRRYRVGQISVCSLYLLAACATRSSSCLCMTLPSIEGEGVLHHYEMRHKFLSLKRNCNRNILQVTWRRPRTMFDFPQVMLCSIDLRRRQVARGTASGQALWVQYYFVQCRPVCWLWDVSISNVSLASGLEGVGGGMCGRCQVLKYLAVCRRMATYSCRWDENDNFFGVCGIRSSDRYYTIWWSLGGGECSRFEFDADDFPCNRDNELEHLPPYRQPYQ
jgi:hypothetical protein